MSDIPEAKQDPVVCFEQKQATAQVERALKKMANHLERDKIASVFHLQVYAFNCDNRRHEQPNTFHMDYVAGSAHQNIPDSLQVTIKSLEQVLVELKKRVQ